MKKFKHKITGDIAIMKSNNSSFYTYDGVDIHARIVENSCDWEEILDLPVGTKVVDTNPETKGLTYEKLPDGYWKIGNANYITISESSIGEGKRFQIIKEEVKRDWEILSFTNSSGDMFYLNNQGYYDWNGDKKPSTWRTLKHMLKVTNCKINSVKRLSDGEIFQIGDETKNGKITEFFINEENQTLFVRSDKPKWDYCSTILKYCEKVKTVLFITEDGKEIREEDRFWVVSNDYVYIFDTTDIVLKSPNHKKGLYKYFSTREAAEEYMIMNKPCLSINDFKNVIKMPGIEVIKPLKKLVKSKI